MTSHSSKKLSSASKKLLKQLPSEAAMDDLISDLKQVGHRATAIVGAAYLEHALELLISTHFVPLEKEDYNRLFDGSQNGILAGLAAKIRMAYAMGLIASGPYVVLALMNDIRNTFAHSLHNVDFHSPEIVADCKQLLAVSDILTEAAKVSDESSAQEIYAGFTHALYRALRSSVQLELERRGGASEAAAIAE
jgi:DNA-binding MltR family transcriptional regulator